MHTRETGAHAVRVSVLHARAEITQPNFLPGTTCVRTAAEAKASFLALDVFVPHPSNSSRRGTHPGGTRIGTDSSEGRSRVDNASMARFCNAGRTLVHRC